MLGSEYSWTFDGNAGQQVPDYLLDAGTFRIESENADGGLQLDCEQLQQGRCHEPLADTRERLSKQDERIRELELALQQQQTFIDIPRQWVEVQTNFEQYFKRFTDWAEEHS
ncbi:unnamed protein product [Alternaria alternata]